MENFWVFLKEANLDTKKHQIEGVKWCLEKELRGTTIYKQNIRGGIIADDMGLGKTIQMLGIIVANIKPHTLIVLPRSLLEQWTNIFIKMLGHKPLIYHGADKKHITPKILWEYPVPIVLTTYGVLVNDKTLYRIKWDRIIYDEAHHLRNVNTKISKCAKRIKSNVTWLVTGTPIQNYKSDLYSLCEVLKIPENYYTNPENLLEFKKTFLLRRTKEQVNMYIPKLNTSKIEIKWSNKYEENFAKNIHASLSFSNVSKHSNSYAAMLTNETLSSLIRSRQMCIYPRLIKKKLTQLLTKEENSLVAEKINTHVTLKLAKFKNIFGIQPEMNIWEFAGISIHPNMDEFISVHNALNSSTKIDAVINKIVQRKNNNNSKLIFCHFRGEIDIIKKTLEKHNICVCVFDGRTSNKERNKILNNKCDVLILQIQTGCEGLNLQQFSEIYFVSPHWNPAIEDQAIARCHRIGQTKEVNVFRFFMEGFNTEKNSKTIDKYTENIQINKRTIIKLL